jgi:acetyl-CoA acyltransferase
MIYSPTPDPRYPDGLVGQGVSAELIDRQWKLDRETLDAYAARSHRLAVETAAAGGFDHEIVVPDTVDGHEHRHDETIRASTTPEGLSGLKPSFATPGSPSGSARSTGASPRGTPRRSPTRPPPLSS